MMKKVLIATGIYPPDIGGPATYSKLLFDELPKYGIRVKVLSFGSVRSLPKIIRHFVYFLKVLKQSWDVDVIFAQDPVSVGLPVCLASFFLRKKFVLKIVGDYAWEQFVQGKSSDFPFLDLEEFQIKKFDFLTELRRKIERGVAKRAAQVIVPSQYLKKIILKWGVEEDKIKVIYNPLALPDLKISKSEARQKLGLSGFILISAARLVGWKGMETLIEIMPEILKKIPEASLVIIGEGPEKGKLKSKIEKLGLERKILLTGQLEHRSLLIYLKAGDVFVLNSGYEGFSHLLLEALMMEIPIVTTKVGGNPEIIKDKINGVLVDYNNKDQLIKSIFIIYKDEELRAKFREQGRKFLKILNKDEIVRETLKILKYGV